VNHSPSQVTLVLLIPPERLLRTTIFENLAFLYLEASLEKAGYRCSIIDNLAFRMSYQQVRKAICADPPSLILGFAIFDYNCDITIKMIRDLRESGYKGHIVLGGIWASLRYRELLTTVKEIDSVAVGEGENLIVELAGCLSGGCGWSAISGIASRNDGDSISFAPREMPDDVDSLQVPERSGYYSSLASENRLISISASRGCHMRCSFCNISRYISLCGGTRWRPRNPEKVVDEIEHIVKTTEMRNFNFIDDCFTGRGEEGLKRAQCFAEEILRRGLVIRFSICTRSDGINMELFSELKRAGLSFVLAGIESFSDSQLVRYRKGTTVETNLKALTVLDKLGIAYSFALILIDPYVTRDEIVENLEIVKNLRVDRIANIMGYIKLNEYLEMFESCSRDSLIRDVARNELGISRVSYDFRYDDVRGLAEKIMAMSDILDRCMKELLCAKVEKHLYLSGWLQFENRAIVLLKKAAHRYLRQVVFSDNADDEARMITVRLNAILKSISSLVRSVSREDILEQRKRSIDIDGTVISMRPPDLDEVVESFSVSGRGV